MSDQSRHLAVILFFLAGLSANAKADTLGVVDTGRLQAGHATMIWALSADGAVAAGTSGTGTARRAIRYTAAGGVQDLGLLNGRSTSNIAYSYAFGTAVSADGTTIVGKVSDAGGVGQAFYWTQSKAIQGLGYLHEGISSVAYAVSQDGSFIAGTANDGLDGQNEKAVLWSGQDKKIQTLGLGRISTDGINASPYASAISADGKTVVGWATNNKDSYAWLWVSGDANIRKFLPVAYSAGYSDASGLSQDGSTIVGTLSTANNQNNLQAYSYKIAEQSVRLLGLLNNSSGNAAYSYAAAVSKDGSVVVGQASDGAHAGRDAAYRWTAGGGMLTIEQWLKNAGVSVSTTDLYASTANAVSADGCVVGGQLSNGNGFVAKGCNAAGLIDSAQFQTSLSTAQQTVINHQLVHSDLVLNGLNGSPLSLKTEAGRFSVGLAGDLGGSDSNHAGANRLGELFVAYGFEQATTFKIGLGMIESGDNKFQTGTSRSDGLFVTPEVVAKIDQTELYLSVLGFYGIDRLNIRRIYTNAGIPAASEGDVKAQSYGGRIRVDWGQAVKIKALSLTPFVSLTAIRTMIGAYTETGNSFPATWNAYAAQKTLARLGFDSSYTMNEQVNLISRLEAVHRLETRSPIVSGRLADIGEFSTTPATYQQNWLRFGFGAEIKAGQGLASFMINRSTATLNPYWANIGYKFAL